MQNLNKKQHIKACGLKIKQIKTNKYWMEEIKKRKMGSNENVKVPSKS